MRVTRALHTTATFAMLWAAALLFLLSSAVCGAVEPLLDPPQQQLQQQQQQSLLGPGDWVSIAVTGQPEANSYVNADGTITVPLAGNIPVSGISPDQAAARVAKALKDGGYFVDPHVVVRATQPQSQFVSVVGEVQAQGRYPITSRTSIVDLLAQAGGMKDTAADVGYVLRKDDAGNINRYPVNLNVLANAKMPATPLLGGDSLLVPRAEHFSIEGEVASPGRYRIEPGMTVMQAIARAGGITERGSERRIQLKRVGKPGQYQTVHAKPGDPVQPDDIIRVKESIF